MRNIVILSLIFVIAQAKVFYAKIEPYEQFKVSSSVSGTVIFINSDLEGRNVKSDLVLKIDDYLERKELESIKQKLKFVEENIELNRDLKHNYEDILVKKEANYNSIKDLSIKSKVEKDRDYFDMINSKNQLINVSQSLINLGTQKNDLEFRITTLKKTIKEKNLRFKNKYLYKFLVKEGEMATPSKPLIELYDISKAKLVFYVSQEEKEIIQSSVIYLDGKKTEYKIDKIWDVADSTHLSSYRAEIIIEGVKQFSKLMSIEFKNE